MKFDYEIIVKTAYTVLHTVPKFSPFLAGDTTIGSRFLWFACIHAATSMTYLYCRSQLFLMWENNILATTFESIVQTKYIQKLMLVHSALMGKICMHESAVNQ